MSETFPGTTPVRDFPFVVYAVVFVLYVAAGYFLQTTVLNYLVGPFVLLAVLHVLPALATRVRRALRKQS